MNMPLRRLLQSLTVSLPLLLGPLGAQESPPDAQKPAAAEPTSPTPAAAEPVAAEPAKEVPAPAASPADADADDDAGTEENVSADNSLSFPVDI